MQMTLNEILKCCDNWEDFCDQYGWDYYAVNEGGGEIEQELTLDEAYKLGILKRFHGFNREGS